MKTEMNIGYLKEVHTKFHALYGYGNNTIEQWNDFVSKN